MWTNLILVIHKTVYNFKVQVNSVPDTHLSIKSLVDQEGVYDTHSTMRVVDNFTLVQYNSYNLNNYHNSNVVIEFALVIDNGITRNINFLVKVSFKSKLNGSPSNLKYQISSPSKTSFIMDLKHHINCSQVLRFPQGCSDYYRV